jgi:DNA-binding NarL/FixJ family response regulator
MQDLNRTFVGLEEDDIAIHRERLVGFLVLSVVVALTTLDVIEDFLDGATLFHVIFELLIILCSALAAGYLWLKLLRRWRLKENYLERSLVLAHEDIKKWREKSSSLADGVTKAIEEQLERWGLSEAEKDVAFLLIKGLSLKELASARKTSESTVRQQAASIYKKSGLEGRAQLSAFFLEDLLAPRFK